MSGGGLVLDTSVVLNILGSGRAETILGALNVRRLVIAVTSREILRHPLHPKAGGDPLESIIAAGLVEKIPLPDVALARFVDLTGAASPDDLDDGEAAALAAGEALNLSVALDEAKGRRVAKERLPGVPLLSSGAVFLDAAVASALGADLAEAVFSTLVHARMRVLPEHDAWVRTLLGPARAAQCPSLRKKRRP
jgi:hypothetical protein